ncbi:unnamed protein product [Porites evermanni]|uniref:Sulfotransferase domain-containing protein n=1 Tax=Porites evermanni TaxID=104178 RepID=A0ABN8RZR2_9CNID|nr:unnamed protein product [Porites evermanni]
MRYASLPVRLSGISSMSDLLLHVRMIANFLNKPLFDDFINRIAEQCTFKKMKKNDISYKIRNEESSLLLRK